MAIPLHRSVVLCRNNADNGRKQRNVWTRFKLWYGVHCIEMTMHIHTYMYKVTLLIIQFFCCVFFVVFACKYKVLASPTAVGISDYIVIFYFNFVKLFNAFLDTFLPPITLITTSSRCLNILKKIAFYEYWKYVLYTIFHLKNNR